MRKTNRLLSGFRLGVSLVCLGAAGLVLSQEQTSSDYFGEIDDSAHPSGYREYVEMGCYQCHGFQGQGALNPSLVRPLLPYQVFAEQVRRPKNVMPAYSMNVLSEARLRSIYNYLENVPESPEVNDIPLLSID